MYSSFADVDMELDNKSVAALVSNVNNNLPISEDLSVDRLYNTRLTNKAYSAKKFGLKKCTKDAIAAEARCKRLEREEAMQQKQEAEAEQKKKEERQVAELAALEDQLQAMRNHINGVSSSQAGYSAPKEDEGNVPMEDNIAAKELPSKKHATFAKVSEWYVYI